MWAKLQTNLVAGAQIGKALIKREKRENFEGLVRSMHDHPTHSVRVTYLRDANQGFQASVTLENFETLRCKLSTPSSFDNLADWKK